MPTTSPVLSASAIRAASFLCLAACLSTARASAQGSEAERLFQEGRELLSKEKFQPACEKLEKSHQLDPALGTLALLAFCHESVGRTATAYNEYREAARIARTTGDPERARILQTRIEKLEPELSRLTVNATDTSEGLEIFVGDAPLPQSQWGMPVPTDPGTIRVRARAPGKQPWAANVTLLADGNHVVVSVPELSRAEAEPSHVNVPMFVAFGVGAAGALVGGYFGVRAKGLNDDSMDHCDSLNRCDARGFSLREDAHSAARVSNAAFAIGLAGAAVGVVLFVLDDSSSSETSAQVVATPSGAALGIDHRF